MSDIQLLQWIYLFLMHQKHVLLFDSPVSQMWNAQGSDERPMTRDTSIGLFLMGELDAALRANDPDLFKRWLYGGIEDLGEPVVEELLLDWIDPFLTVEEQDRLLGGHLRVSL